MAIPNFQSLMLPLLSTAADGEDHALAESRDILAREFQLTDADREELLPSGQQLRFSNRVAWARTYLQQSGLLVAPRRGYIRITDRGRGVLNSPPTRINIKFLEQYPEFLEFKAPSKLGMPTRAEGGDGSEAETPEEALEAANLKIRAGLASELLLKVRSAPPEFFEQLVVGLLLKMGYGGSREDAGQAIGKSGDEGIDGVITEDRLGLDVVYLQAKRWDGTVGRPEIQKFVGALHGKRARKGVFITTGTFSPDATAYVTNIEPKVALIDGRRLSELMIDFDVGVTRVAAYDIKRIDSDYFDDS